MAAPASEAIEAAPPAAASTTAVIRTVDLSKAYGSTTALAGLTLSVEAGEVFGFLGPNGAGKTTAVKLLVGLSKPTAGEAWVLGARAGDLDVARRIGYLPELFRYQDWLTGREVLELHCRLARIPKPRRRAEIDYALELSGLRGREGDRVGTYSKGMQQRLGLGVALLGSPQVIFLDEPTSALDPVGRHEVREIIHAVKARGATVFLNTHLLSEVELVCDRVAIVDFGRVVAAGTIDDLRRIVQGVRVKARPLSEGTVRELDAFGTVRTEGEAVMIAGAGPESVPAIVRLLVAQGADVFSVEPAGTLEDSFLSLLQGGNDGDPDPRRSHAP